MSTIATPVQASDKLQSLFERDERLIDVIASHSPQLAKLRHSPMRRIMARVTTVAQAARLCRMSADSLVRDLNHAIGIDTVASDVAGTDAIGLTNEPTVVQWSIPSSLSVVELDVREELSNGGEPFSRIMGAVAGLGEREVLHLRAPFEPVPLFAVMQKRGFAHAAEQHADDDWSVWFFRQEMTTEFPAAATIPAPVPASSHAIKPGAGNAPARAEVWLDVRDMEPPEPLVRTLEALEHLPAESMLVQFNVRIPQFLLPILRERGFHFTIDEPQRNEVQVRIWRAE